MNDRLLPGVSPRPASSSRWLVGDAIRYTKRFESGRRGARLDERIVKSDKASCRWALREEVLRPRFSASDEVTRGAQATRAFLVESGFAEAEIRTTPVSLNDNWVMGSNRPANRFTARGGLVVETDKVDAIMKSVERTGELLKQGVVVENSFARYYWSPT